ncbi:MAG: adenosine deaminase [Microthrixaceae bacterium]
MAVPDRDLMHLPKAHLHLHLEGSMRPATLRSLCEANGLDVPQIRGFGSFAAFADTYVAACAVLRTPQDLSRLIDEVVEDAAGDGCSWIEPAFYPAHHEDRLGPQRDVWEMAFQFGQQAAERHGVGVGWIAGLDRTCDPEDADRVLDVALDLVGEGAPIIGLGLHNDEAGHPPEPFERQFARGAEAGLLRVPHAGELAGPESVRGALDVLGADRIQHGVRAIEDKSLVRQLADRAVVLDVCPTSNLMLGVTEQLEDHPLPALLDAGVRCSLNADDPLLFGPGILEEYQLARESLALDDETLAAIAGTSFSGSAAPAEIVSVAQAEIDAWLSPD